MVEAKKAKRQRQRVKQLPNGAGSITKNERRGRWEGRITVGIRDSGSAIRKSVTGKTYDEVVVKLAALRERWEAAGGDPTAVPAASLRSGSDVTLGAWLDEWLAGLPDSGLSPVTVNQYRTMVEAYIRPRLGRRPLAKLSVRDVEAWLRWLRDEGATKTGGGVSSNTRRQARNVLSAALAKAVKVDLIPRNVARLADSPEGGDVKSGRTMTPEQLRTFLDALAGHEFEALYAVMVLTGLRKGEALGLAWSDVDLDGDRPTLRVRRSLKKIGSDLFLDTPKTDNSARLVRLPDRTLEPLRQLRERQDVERAAIGDGGLWGGDRFADADLVFTDAFGLPLQPDRVYRTLRRITEDAGLGSWGPHELRHTAASLMLAGSVPVAVVSKVLGHSSIRVTADVYAHLLDEAFDDAAAALDRLTA